MKHSDRCAPLALLVALALTACNTLPDTPGTTVDVPEEPEVSIEEASPSDIVVAPIVNETGLEDFPAEALRSSFQQGLIKRRYSPLSNEYVDLHVVDGVYTPGTLAEDAVLEILVDGWDTTYLNARGAVWVQATVRMVDASTQSLLWSGRVDDTYELGPQRGTLATTRSIYARVCDLIATEVLGALPSHEAQP